MVQSPAMSVFVDDISALEFWRSPLASSANVRSDVRVDQTFRAKTPTEWEIEEARHVLGLAGQPLHVLVPKGSRRGIRGRVVCRETSHSLGRGSFVSIAPGLYVASPELCFVRLAEILSFAELVEVGCELSGSYRKDSSTDRGFSDGPPLTGRKALLSSALACSMDGSKPARRAAKYVAEGSASPMETALVLLLCLPKSCGGYGLPFPVMNHRVEFASPTCAAGPSFCLCDLCWPEHKLDVEYDSDAFHGAPKRIADDARRRGRLDECGYSVLTVGRRQVFDARDLERMALLIGKHLGVRVRRERIDRDAQVKLRRALLGFGRA